MLQQILNDGRTLLGEDRLQVIENITSHIKHLPGSTAEVGVYKGGVSKLIALLLPNKTHYCFDTFTGIPNAQPEIDNLMNGSFSTSYEEVVNYLKVCPNIVFKKGYFPDTTNDIKDRFCLVHLDGDTYRTTIDALNFFYSKIVSGGHIILDDWKGKDTLGVEKAVREFFKDKPEQIEEQVPVQCFIIKLSKVKFL